MDGLIKAATLEEAEIVVTAFVGMIGIRPTLEAIKAKKDIALANKETLVTAGHLVIPAAKENGVKVALETVGANWTLGNKLDFFGSFNEYKSLFDDVKNSEYGEWFVCCIDTGHINLTAQHNEPSAAEFVRRLGKNVACLHLHDNFGTVDHHRVIGAGTTDWPDFFKALTEISYEGVYNSETDFAYISGDLMIATADFTVKTIKSYISRY